MVPPRQVSLCFLNFLVLCPLSVAPRWLIVPPNVSRLVLLLSAPTAASWVWPHSCLPRMFYWFLNSSACNQYCTPFLHFQSIFLTVTRYKVNIYIRVKPTFILCFCVSGTDLENWHILSVILTIYIVTPIFHQRKLSFIDVISGWLCAWSLLGWVNCIFFQDSAQRISSSVSSLLSENSASDFVYCIL